MAGNSGWRLFTSSLKVKGSPTLLIKHETTVQDNGRVSRLKVCVTDLTYLWIETLERKELIRKACDTSIDPTDQLDILLEYLNRGLNFAPRTSLLLRSERGRSHLVLHLKSPLPEPLKPLEWDFDLRQATELDFTREFILPLIGNLFESQVALRDLELIISNKDKAIERIDTELKTHNKQITGLFDKRFYGENVAEKNKKGILMNKIPGFRPFDTVKWQEDREEQVLPNLRDLNKLLFEHGLPANAISDSLSQEAWWENLGNGVEVEEPSQISQVSQISQPVRKQRASTSAFQSFQALGDDTREGYKGPNGLRSSSPIDARPMSANNHDVENDSDATASISSDLESQIPHPQFRKIGKIGRTAAQADQSEGLNKASSSKPDARSGSRSTDIEANESRPRGGIGKIGGSRAMHGPETTSPTRLSQSERLPTRVTLNPTEDDQRLDLSSRNLEAAETAEQRANRQRAMLKHELEEKRKAPAKKKRKF